MKELQLLGKKVFLSFSEEPTLVVARHITYPFEQQLGNADESFNILDQFLTEACYLKPIGIR